MNNPKISIIVPLYNKEKSIIQTLDSIFKQTFQCFELVIVDDGSTDGSYYKVLEYKSRNKIENIQIIQQKNAGPGAARNTGTKHAKAKWIVFLDADDELLPYALDYFWSIVEENPKIDIVDCNTSVLSKGKVYEKYHPIEGIVKIPLRECFFNKIGPGSNHSCFNRNFCLKYPYREEIRRFEDAELLVRQLQTAKVYSSKKSVALVHTEYSAASHPRKNVEEDYFAYLDFKSGGFWRKMCVYRTYLEERTEYPETAKNLYGHMRYRYDWLLVFKILNKFKMFFQ